LTAEGKLRAAVYVGPALADIRSESKRGSVWLPSSKYQSQPAVPPGRLIVETQCVGRTYRAYNPVQPRKIMPIIEKIMRVIVQERSIRELSVMSARLPVDAGILHQHGLCRNRPHDETYDIVCHERYCMLTNDVVGLIANA
jgi:uncharacterized protein YjiS (DUF1127 family)